MGTLVAEVAALGLAVAFTSPVSVVTVIVLLSMPSGRRRAIAFVCGWLIAIVGIGASEILKANVSRLDAATAIVVFSLTSIVTIAAPIVVALASPERSAQRLGAWKAWLLGNSRAVVLVALMVVAALLIVRGISDLV